jgi:PTH1 family peptidyl-tRNA hydrolase
MIDTIFSEFKSEKKFSSYISKDYSGSNELSPILGIKPDTYMNLSGDAVASVVSFYKLDPKKDILVISDDIDMEF